MRNRSVVIALVVALLATAGWWFGLYSPKDQQLAQVQTEIDGLAGQQQQLRNEITQLREVESNQVQIRADLTRLEDYIPSDPEQPSVMRQLQESADAAGVDIASVTFGKPAPVLGAPPS
ncbi:MAG TPA: type II secretion system protein GspM, partial [Coriobacteriia bacterium]|nr:type II secretion system protein GspM [Coriobacteriia bacterium]